MEKEKIICTKCGFCCKAIPLRKKIKDMKVSLPVDEYRFILAHWHPVSTPEVDLNSKANRSKKVYWHSCDLLDTKTNLCTVYENKPLFCKNYPGEMPDSDLISDKCVFFGRYK